LVWRDRGARIAALEAENVQLRALATLDRAIIASLRNERTTLVTEYMGAREARYAEAIYTDATTRWGTGILDSTDAMSEYELNACAVLPLADAEVAAAVSEAQAEAEGLLVRRTDDLARALRERDASRAEVERLREGIQDLADEWASFGPTDVAWHWDKLAARVRDLLDPSPAATTGETPPRGGW